MKHTIKLFGSALVAAVLFLSSCGGGEAPKQVATKFLTAIEDKKFDEAANLATDDTKAAIELIKGFASMMPADAKKKEFEFGEEKIDGDKATVKYKEKGSDKDQEISLVKKDGKWLVSMTKEQMSGGGKTEETPVPDAGAEMPAESSKPADATATPAN